MGILNKVMTWGAVSAEFLSSEAVADVPALNAVELEDHPQEECGVYALYIPERPGDPDSFAGEGILQTAYRIAGRLQHRGRSAAGVAYVDGVTKRLPGPDGEPDMRPIYIVHKDIGTVDHALTAIRPSSERRREEIARLEKLIRSPMLVGHDRYSTAEGDDYGSTQPFLGRKSGIALAHNGHIDGMQEIAEAFGVALPEQGLTDSAILTLLIDEAAAELGSVEAALHRVLPYLPGAYCLTITDGTNIYAVRDPWGFHPLAIGKIPGGGSAVASEPLALRGITELVRDVEPGEIVAIGPHGERSSRIDLTVEPRRCKFEYIYLALPGGVVDGVSISQARKNMGKHLAEDYPVVGDDVVVVGVPSTGQLAAKGYAGALNLVEASALYKADNSGRTFILRGSDRQQVLGEKFWIDPDEVRGKRVVLVDDSLIKGNTMRQLVKMFRDAGAAEVHIRLAAPRYEYACRMGMDTHNLDLLIARGKTNAEIAAAVGADSVEFNSVGRVQQAVETAIIDPTKRRQLGRLCTGCTLGDYPFGAVRHVAVALGIPAMRGPVEEETLVTFAAGVAGARA